MNDVIKFLNENPLIYLATEGLDGNAKVRPILYYFEEYHGCYQQLKIIRYLFDLNNCNEFTNKL